MNLELFGDWMPVVNEGLAGKDKENVRLGELGIRGRRFQRRITGVDGDAGSVAYAVRIAVTFS